jgi:CMP/dCMP kinase
VPERHPSHGMLAIVDTANEIPKRGPVVAIDGPAGAGNSSLARVLAGRLLLPYINTGLMYRAVAFRALEAGVPPTDEEGLARIAGGMRFSVRPGPVVAELVIDGGEPPLGLTSEAVEAIVSEVARHPLVRSALRTAQRRLGADGCVMEGRDIGTVVFPDADVKIFLSAGPEVRARRRERERGGGSEVGMAVARRDALDSKTNPLRAAPDAHVLDTNDLAPDEVVARAAALVRDALGEGRAG